LLRHTTYTEQRRGVLMTVALPSTSDWADDTLSFLLSHISKA
jgi:hypothetical protein